MLPTTWPEYQRELLSKNGVQYLADPTPQLSTFAIYSQLTNNPARKFSRAMDSLGPAEWVAIAIAALATVMSVAGAIISLLLVALTYLAKLFFDDASSKLAELPEIKTELTESRYARQGDRKDIDRAHERLDVHEVRITAVEER